LSTRVAARRNRELRLLTLALIIGGGALTLVALARGADRAAAPLPYLAVVAFGYVVAHLVMRRFAPQADSVLLPIAATLNFLGLAAIFRLSPNELGPLQVTWTVIGLACFIGTVIVLRDYTILGRYKYILGFIGVGLLLVPMTPVGAVINGARLWVRIGPLSFQPGELAKICLVIFFAAYLAERKELLAYASRRIGGLHVPDLKHFGPLLVMWGLSLAVMFFERFVYMAVGMALFSVGAYFGYQMFSHVQARVTSWLNVFDPKLINDESYQLAQSLFALATGGLFGTGLGLGRPDLIPAAQTDFIFSVIGEELGLLGTAGILVCFMLIVARGLRIALRSRDDFPQLLAAGLTTIFAVQTVIILAGVTRLMPLTGITLPFMSYGGSSLLSNFILIAILVRISHQTVAAPAPAHTAEILIGAPPRTD
jgi:cell division protein FtsW (lipid II flippase)